MARRASVLKKLGTKGKQKSKKQDRITVFLPIADKMRYAYLCEKKNIYMTNDLAEHIKKFIEREKENIPEAVEKKICEMTQEE